MSASATIRRASPPIINMTGSTKASAMEVRDDIDDRTPARFPIAAASEAVKKRKLTKAVFRRVFDILSSLSTR